MNTSHYLTAEKMIRQETSDGSFRLMAAAKNFPILKGMSFYKLHLKPLSAREPHWHANADELGYCTKGKLLISLYKYGNIRDHFVINKGEMFYIPSGTLHSVENLSQDSSEAILQFSNEAPEDFALSSTLGMFSDGVLGNTWGVLGASFEAYQRSLKEVFIGKRKTMPTIEESDLYVSPYKYKIESAFPLISNPGGNVRVARQDTWQVLKNQSLYSLVLTNKGMREPHWHPETAELGYVNKGRIRMSILTPKSDVETYEIGEGDIYFIPAAYPHHIENLSDESSHLLVFFDQSQPKDIGLSASVKSFSPDLLTASLNCPEALFPSLPTYYSDLLIVERINPLD